MRLKGKRVVNTRALHQAEALNALLRAEGATPIDYPALAMVPPEDTNALDAALRDAGSYALLVLTSANTVESLTARANALGVSLRGMQTAAVGAATAQAAREKLGVEITFVPNESNARALGEGLAITPGMRVLLPQSEIAAPTLAQTLTTRGAAVTALTAYRTVRGSGGAMLMPLLHEGEIDAVTFTSASAVRYFAERLGIEGVSALGGVKVVCMSAQISDAAQRTGYVVAAEARSETLEALVEALAIAFE